MHTSIVWGLITLYVMKKRGYPKAGPLKQNAILLELDLNSG